MLLLTFVSLAVCAHRGVSSYDQRPWWWSVLWLHLQIEWDWGRCHCHGCAHILWEVGTILSIQQTKLAMSRRQASNPALQTCLLSSLANLWREKVIQYDLSSFVLRYQMSKAGVVSNAIDITEHEKSFLNELIVIHASSGRG